MADKDINFKIHVDTQEAIQNVDNLNASLTQTKEKSEEVNKTVSQGTAPVSAWGQAFESVLNEASKGTGSLGGSLGKITSTIKTSIPLIKNVTSTATKGLKAIKAGIAGTGIGLLVIALVEIISHWKDIANLLGISTDRQSRYEKAVEESKKAVEKLNKEHERQLKFLRASGASSLDVAKKSLEYEREELQTITDQYRADVRNNNYSKRQLRKRYEAYLEAWKAQKEIVDLAKDEVKAQEISAQKDRDKAAAAAAREAATKRQAEAEKRALDYLNEQKTVYGVIGQILRENKNENADFWKEIIKPETPNLPATQLLEEVKKAGKELNSSLVQDAIQGNEVLLKQKEDNINHQIKLIQLGANEEYQTEKDKADAIAILENEIWQARIQLAEDSLNAAKAYDGENHALINQLNADYQQVKQAEEVYDAEFNKNLATNYKTRKQAEKNFAEEEKKMAYDHQKEMIDIEVGNEAKKNEQLSDLEKKRLLERKTYLEELQKLEVEGSEAYKNIGLQITEIDNLIKESNARRTQYTKQSLLEDFQAYAEITQDVASLLGDIIDGIVEVKEAQLDTLVKQNKISQEEADEILAETQEKLKGWQIAQTWINALAGSAAALSSPAMMSAGPPGWIAAGVQAAALITNAIITTEKIKNTTYGSGGAGSSGGNTPQYTPIHQVQDVTPAPTMNVPVSSEDTRVYILESDIQRSNSRVKVREENTTW